MNGVLVVDKPSGPTSHAVVARVRRAIGVDRIGHTGTLDPLATGVLPLVVGRATRLAQYLTANEKEYVAGIRFGAVSSTYDAEGALTATGFDDASRTVTHSTVEEALAGFRGSFDQVPPPFSAKKVSGTRAYRLARSQQPVTLKPVPVRVTTLQLVSLADDLAVVRLECSSGFYVRSLAHELGQRFGCGAFLESLQRTRAGSFTIDAAVPLATVESSGPDARRLLITMERLLPEIPGLVVTAAGSRRVSHGNSLSVGDFVDSGALAQFVAATGAGERMVRLLDEAGNLLAIAHPEAGGLLHPAVVLM